MESKDSSLIPTGPLEATCGKRRGNPSERVVGSHVRHRPGQVIPPGLIVFRRAARYQSPGGQRKIPTIHRLQRGLATPVCQRMDGRGPHVRHRQSPAGLSVFRMAPWRPPGGQRIPKMMGGIHSIKTLAAYSHHLGLRSPWSQLRLGLRINRKGLWRPPEAIIPTNQPDCYQHGQKNSGQWIGGPHVRHRPGQVIPPGLIVFRRVSRYQSPGEQRKIPLIGRLQRGLATPVWQRTNLRGPHVRHRQSSPVLIVFRMAPWRPPGRQSLIPVPHCRACTKTPATHAVGVGPHVRHRPGQVIPPGLIVFRRASRYQSPGGQSQSLPPW